MAEKRSRRVYWEIIKVSVLPVAAIAIMIFFYEKQYEGIRSAFSMDWEGAARKLFFIVVVAVMALWMQMLAGAGLRLYKRSIARRTRTSLDEQFIPLFIRIANVFIWVIAIIVVLSYLGVNINALIAAMGVGSLAIALAAQDTIANVIAGFLIMLDRPFEVGDEVGLPSGERVVALSIGIRRAKFRLPDGSLVIVPNLDLSKNKIVNYTKRQGTTEEPS